MDNGRIDRMCRTIAEHERQQRKSNDAEDGRNPKSTSERHDENLIMTKGYSGIVRRPRSDTDGTHCSQRDGTTTVYRVENELN